MRHYQTIRTYSTKRLNQYVTACLMDPTCELLGGVMTGADGEYLQSMIWTDGDWEEVTDYYNHGDGLGERVTTLVPKGFAEVFDKGRK